MHFDWAYTFGLLKNKDFWQATLTVIELSVLVWILGPHCQNSCHPHLNNPNGGKRRQPWHNTVQSANKQY